MEIVINTLLENIKNNWNAEDLGTFLSDIYALGVLDSSTGRNTYVKQNFLLISPLLDCDIVDEYINTSLEEYEDFMEDKACCEEDVEEEF